MKYKWLRLIDAKNRAWLISIMFIFIFCAYLFSYFYQSEKNRKINEIANNQKIHAKQAAKSFNELFDKWNSMLFYLSNDPTVISLNSDGKNQLESLLRVLKNEIAGITRTDENGSIIFTTPNNAKSIGADISKQKHMVNILANHKPVISDVFLAVQGFQAIVIHYPILSNGKYKGSIAFLLNFERIASEILDDLSDGTLTRTWLISAEGTELYCFNKDHIGKSAFETSGSSVKQKELAKLMMTGKEGKETFVFKDMLNGEINALVYFLPIKLNDTFWSLAIASSKDEFGASLYDFSLKLIFVFSIVFLGGVLLSNYVLKALAIYKETEARKKAEEELKLSEEKHRLISEVTSDYVFATQLDDERNLIHYWISGAFSSITEYTIDEYKEIGGWAKCIYEDDVHIDELAQQKLNNNQPAVSELRTVTKSGKILWVRVFAHPVWNDKENKLVGIYGAVQNIDESKKAEFALIENEEKFRTIFNSTNDAMFIHDKNTGAILDVNLTMENMFGVTREEAISNAVVYISAGFSPYSQKEALEWIYKTTELGQQTFEWLCKTKAGTLFWVEVSMSIAKISGEERVLASVRNISERKKFEDQLQTFRLAMDQSSASIVITNSEGIIEYVNAGFCNISGYTNIELVGVPLRILNDQKVMDVNRDEIWNTIKEGKEWRSEHKNKRKDGSYYWESTLISPVKDNEGKIVHFLAVQEDITVRKETESKLLEAISKAEEMSRLKANFLSNMSHDLRTPLVGMLGISEFLYDELEGANKEFAGMIYNSSNRLLSTLNTLLNYSKIESEAVVPIITKVSVLELLADEVKLFSALAEKNGLQIRKEFLCKEFSVDTDPNMLKEIIANLINNAIRFTERGSIIVTVERNDSEYCLSVSDTGIGIPEDKVEIIFEEFRQVSEGKGRNFEGTGLGLTIVKKYVAALNGTIKVDSKENVGTTFKVCFPLINRIEEIIEDTPIQEKPFTKELYDAEKSNVLLVEDDEINSFAITHMINQLCNTTAVGSAADALLMTNKEKFDIILMDINLRHGMSGVDAMLEIRQNPQYLTTPIVALTAYAMRSDKVEFLEIGFTHYLSKPFTKEQITELIVSINKTIRIG